MGLVRDIYTQVLLSSVDSRIQQVSLRFSRANMVRGCAINIKQGMHPVPRSREAFLSSRRVAVTRAAHPSQRNMRRHRCAGELCLVLRYGEGRCGPDGSTQAWRAGVTQAEEESSFSLIGTSGARYGSFLWNRTGLIQCRIRGPWARWWTGVTGVPTELRVWPFARQVAAHITELAAHVKAVASLTEGELRVLPALSP